ncbi:MAG: phosphoenolpyruvate synthase, partial [Nanoarchaeota archaeon]
MDKSKKFILWFDELEIDDVPLVGGKNASLGEMYQNLTKEGVRIPYGFAITATAYQYFIRKAGVENSIKDIMRGLNVKNVQNLAECGRKIRDIIMHADFPPDLTKDIFIAYQKLSKFYKLKEVDVAVRSSATAEDLPDASFAGQQETFLNVRGEHELADSCKKCFASLFTNRAIAYRAEKGFDHFRVYLSIGVQKMVRSDLSSSGVMFTIDTETGFKDAVFITGIYGLGENIVQGTVNPDEFYVFKPTLAKGFKPIIGKILGEKNLRMVYSEDKSTRAVKNVAVPLEDQRKFCITDEEVIQLAKWGCIIENHYSKKRNRWMPMDTEWAKDGQTNQLFIVQARPETVQSRKSQTIIEEHVLRQKGKILAKGKSVGSKIGQGVATVIKHVKDINKFKPGQVLVTEMTDPDWVPIMRMAKAIVTNRGGRTAHAAIISRELGIPCIVGTNNATEKISSGTKITVDCSSGEEGNIYE